MRFTVLILFLLTLNCLGLADTNVDAPMSRLEVISHRLDALSRAQKVNVFPWEKSDNIQEKRDQTRLNLNLQRAIDQLQKQSFLSSKSHLDIFATSSDLFTRTELERQTRISYLALKRSGNFEAASKTCETLFEYELASDMENWVAPCAHSFFKALENKKIENVNLFSRWYRNPILQNNLPKNETALYFITSTFVKLGELNQARSVLQNVKINSSLNQRLYLQFLSYLEKKKFDDDQFKEITSTHEAVKSEREKQLYNLYLGFVYRSKGNHTQAMHSFKTTMPSAVGEKEFKIDELADSNKFNLLTSRNIEKPNVTSENYESISQLIFDETDSHFQTLYKVVYANNLLNSLKLSYNPLSKIAYRYGQLFQVAYESQNLKEDLKNLVLKESAEKTWEIDKRNFQALHELQNIYKELADNISQQFAEDSSSLSKNEVEVGQEYLKRINFDNRGKFQKYFFAVESTTKNSKYKEFISRINKLNDQEKEIVNSLNLLPLQSKNKNILSTFDEKEFVDLTNQMVQLDDLKLNIYSSWIQEKLTSREVIQFYREIEFKIKGIKNLSVFMHEKLGDGKSFEDNLSKKASRKVWREFVLLSNKIADFQNDINTQHKEFVAQISTGLEKINNETKLQRRSVKLIIPEILEYVRLYWPAWKKDILSSLKRKMDEQNTIASQMKQEQIDELKQKEKVLNQEFETKKLWLESMKESIEMGLLL